MSEETRPHGEDGRSVLSVQIGELVGEHLDRDFSEAEECQFGELVTGFVELVYGGSKDEIVNVQVVRAYATGTYDRLANGNEGARRLASVVDWLAGLASLDHDDVAAALLDAIEDAVDIRDPFGL